MKPEVRLIVNALIRLVLIALGVWFAVADAALPPDTHIVTRAGLTILCIIASILVGEVSQLRMHMSMLIGALRQASTGGGSAMAGVIGELEGVPAQDPREAVDTLIRALSAKNPDTRAKVHAHLKRLTGEDLPENEAAWADWWKEHRDSFTATEGGGGA